MNCTCIYRSPLGNIILASDAEALTGLWFACQKHIPARLPPVTTETLPVFEEAFRWLDIYFGGGIPDFTPTLRWNTTPFRAAVWKQLLTIPYGSTVTYGQIAKRVAGEMGRAQMSAQAVGGAVGHNPISLIVPCHRVLGSGGSLIGYDGGVELKAWLLALEQRKKPGSF